MKKLMSLVVAVLSFTVSETANANYIIDDFTTEVSATNLIDSNIDASVIDNPGTNIIGQSGMPVTGLRDIYLDVTPDGQNFGPKTTAGIFANMASTGFLGLNVPTGAGAVFTLVYNNFGTKDLEENGVDAIQLTLLDSDANLQIMLSVFDSGVGASSATLPANNPGQLSFLFSQLVGNAVLSDIVRIEIKLSSASNAWDAAIDQIEGIVSTPEPTSLALAGFAGIGMAVGAIRRRRQAKQAA